MQKVLILGASGMLGSMLTYRFSKGNYSVSGTLRDNSLRELFPDSVNFLPFDVDKDSIRDIIKSVMPDFIINSAGIIKPYCKDSDMEGVRNAIMLNALFPHKLSEVAHKINPEIKIIQIATDCVYNGRKGNYSEQDAHDPEDVYGKTKSLGEIISSNVLNIRCSIIGPEIKSHLSLLDWFLTQKPDSALNGFTHHLWNGVTTLQFADLCHKIISENKFENFRSLNHVLHYVLNESVSKYSLLEIFNKEFNKNFKILPVNSIGEPVDRTIRSVYLKNPIIPMENAISDLNKYIIENKIYTAAC
jgi:dTDP-4-dehydrorhamnose reductase